MSIFIYETSQLHTYMIIRMSIVSETSRESRSKNMRARWQSQGGNDVVIDLTISSVLIDPTTIGQPYWQTMLVHLDCTRSSSICFTIQHQQCGGITLRYIDQIIASPLQSS
jgi:hypothetical protein